MLHAAPVQAGSAQNREPPGFFLPTCEVSGGWASSPTSSSSGASRILIGCRSLIKTRLSAARPRRPEPPSTPSSRKPRPAPPSSLVVRHGSRTRLSLRLVFLDAEPGRLSRPAWTRSQCHPTDPPCHRERSSRGSSCILGVLAVVGAGRRSGKASVRPAGPALPRFVQWPRWRHLPASAATSRATSHQARRGVATLAKALRGAPHAAVQRPRREPSDRTNALAVPIKTPWTCPAWPRVRRRVLIAHP